MNQLTMEIGGMSCGHCVASVTRALRELDGVEVERVTVGSAIVGYDPATTSPARIAQAVEGEGFQVASSG